MKNANSDCRRTLNHQNRNTVVVENKSRTPIKVILDSLERYGEILKYTESQVEDGFNVLFVFFKNQQQVQEAIKEMNSSDNLRVSQWVDSEVLKHERKLKMKQNNMQFISEMMKIIQNPQ